MKLFFFSSLISLWIIIGFFNVLFNSVKSVTEIRQWVPLTDSQKREEIFGELYPFLIFINDNTAPESEIFIFSTDIKTHYLAIYYLYPRVTADTDSEEELRKVIEEKEYKYIALFKERRVINGYKSIATFADKGKYMGSLYQRK